MKSWLRIVAVGFIAFALAGCGGSEADAPPPVTGPAMVMFYTDN